jgi:hypothetical protein
MSPHATVVFPDLLDDVGRMVETNARSLNHFARV